MSDTSIAEATSAIAASASENEKQVQDSITDRVKDDNATAIEIAKINADANVRSAAAIVETETTNTDVILSAIGGMIASLNEKLINLSNGIDEVRSQITALGEAEIEEKIAEVEVPAKDTGLEVVEEDKIVKKKSSAPSRRRYMKL